MPGVATPLCRLHPALSSFGTCTVQTVQARADRRGVQGLSELVGRRQAETSNKNSEFLYYLLSLTEFVSIEFTSLFPCILKTIDIEYGSSEETGNRDRHVKIIQTLQPISRQTYPYLIRISRSHH